MLKQRGLSLVELMIAITLGLILLTGVMEVFLSSKNVFSSQQALSRIQESGRMAVEFLSRDIRMAGFMGCASRSEAIKVTNRLKDAATVTFNFSEGIKGYSQADFPKASSKVTQDIKADTDVIVVRSASSNGVYLTANNDSETLFVNTVASTGTCKDKKTPVSGLCIEDIVVVTDCEKANVFQITNVEAGTGTEAGKVIIKHAAMGNAVSTWGGSTDKQNTFNASAQLLAATSTVYFIADGTAGENGVPARPSLWQNINGTSLELLQGVEDMRITYGMDTEADPDFIPNEYKLAKDVTDWKKVISVRLELLVASIEDGVTQDHQVYTFPTDAKDPTTAEDFRLRQIFSTTIAIRNRIN